MSNEVGRQPVVLVEIDQDFCSLEYGVSPCTAEVGVTGSRKCFNTVFTCQDRQNFTKAFLTLRFCEPQAEVPFTWGAIPTVKSVTTTPTEINPGGGDVNRSPLGARARVNIRLQDSPSSDFNVDKYRDERDYDPLKRGTFWTKWLRRNPYYIGRNIRIREGYLDQDINDMVTRHYIIKDIHGPDANGQVTIIGEDILSLAEIDKAQAPFVTEGELLTGINETATSITIINYRDVDDYPDPSSFSEGYGTVRINDEVMRYTSRTVNVDDSITLSGITRSTDGSEVDEHDEGDNVQLCLRYTEIGVWEVINDLLVNYANVPSEFIPYADWVEEGETWLEQFDVSALITEPEGVENLLGEIAQQCLLFIWWDERDQEVKLKALRPPVETPKVVNDRQNIIAGSWSLSRDDKQRISQIWVYYQQSNPTESLDDTGNYKKLRIRIDPSAESEEEYDETKVKRIFSRWLRTEAQVINLAVRLLDRYRDGARYLKARLDAKDRDLWTGDVADVTLWSQVDETGQEEARRYQVISAEEVLPGEVIEYNMLQYEFIGRFGYYMVEDAPDYSEAEASDIQNGAWWANESGLMPDGSDGWEYQ